MQLGAPNIGARMEVDNAEKPLPRRDPGPSYGGVGPESSGGVWGLNFLVFGVPVPSFGRFMLFPRVSSLDKFVIKTHQNLVLRIRRYF